MNNIFTRRRRHIIVFSSTMEITIIHKRFVSARGNSFASLGEMEEIMKDNFKLVVPGKPEYVGAVRLAVSSLANNVGFDIEAIEDIKVAVSEACTNIVRHGKSDPNEGDDIEYQVSCVICDESICISVIDNGPGYDTNNYKEPKLPSEEEGGLGIFIIRALMDDVEVESEIGKGTQIKMVKYINEI